jgi:hypothetical protein
MFDMTHMDAISSAPDGLRSAQDLLGKTAKQLQSATAPPESPADGLNVSDSASLSDAAVDLLSARQQFEVNARVIHTADEMQKALIDLLL